MNKLKKLLVRNNRCRLLPLRGKLRRLVPITLVIILATGIGLAAYFQSFEFDTAGWFGATRVTTGTRGVPSKTGAFHAEDTDSAFTRWCGYSKTFPLAGYTTSIDIYLDISPPYMNGTQYANDTRFDWTSAISTPQCGHRRDFVFNAGFYTDTDETGSGPRFVISASNNAGRSGANPKNTGRSPYMIYDEGWYTFEHRFRDNGAGVLAVDLTIKNAAGVPLFTWTLSDPSDIIGVTVGGNRYGWFAQDEFPMGLAFDTSMLAGFQDYCTAPQNTPGKVTGGGTVADPVFSLTGDLLSLPALVASSNPGAQANFGFNIDFKNGDTSPRGNLQYDDHDANVHIKATSFSSLIIGSGVCGPNTHASFNGRANVNGVDQALSVDVDDCCEPSSGPPPDTFSIQTQTYSNGGPLVGGNIQIH